MTYCYVQVSNLYFLAIVKQNAAPWQLRTFLHALARS